MNLDKTGNDSIAYMGTLGTTATYAVHIDGRHAFDVRCVEDDPERVIHVALPNGTETHPTAGRFSLTTGTLIEGPDGSPAGVAAGHTNPGSVYSYIIPRIAVMMSRLYVA